MKTFLTHPKIYELDIIPTQSNYHNITKYDYLWRHIPINKKTKTILKNQFNSIHKYGFNIHAPQILVDIRQQKLLAHVFWPLETLYSAGVLSPNLNATLKVTQKFNNNISRRESFIL